MLQVEWSFLAKNLPITANIEQKLGFFANKRNIKRREKRAVRKNVEAMVIVFSIFIL